VRARRSETCCACYQEADSASRCKSLLDTTLQAVPCAVLADEFKNFKDNAEIRVVVEPDLLRVGNLSQVTGTRTRTWMSTARGKKSVSRRAEGGTRADLASVRLEGKLASIAPPKRLVMLEERIELTGGCLVKTKRRVATSTSRAKLTRSSKLLQVQRPLSLSFLSVHHPLLPSTPLRCPSLLPSSATPSRPSSSRRAVLQQQQWNPPSLSPAPSSHHYHPSRPSSRPLFPLVRPTLTLRSSSPNHTAHPHSSRQLSTSRRSLALNSSPPCLRLSTACTSTARMITRSSQSVAAGRRRRSSPYSRANSRGIRYPPKQSGPPLQSEWE
jgi:hypothetical protein